MNEKIVIKNLDTDLDAISKIVANGDIPICGRCKSPLTVALNVKDAKDQNVHPGVYCPKNKNHFGIMIEIWDQETKDFYNEVIKKHDD